MDMLHITQRQQVKSLKTMAEDQKKYGNQGGQKIDLEAVQKGEQKITSTDISKENAKLNADILSHKAKLLEMDKVLTDKQKEQYKNYILELEARKEELEIAEKILLVGQKELENSKTRAQNQVRRSQRGREKQTEVDEEKRSKLEAERKNIIDIERGRLQEEAQNETNLLQEQYQAEKNELLEQKNNAQKAIEEKQKQILEKQERIDNQEQAIQRLEQKKNEGSLTSQESQALDITRKNLQQNQQELVSLQEQKSNFELKSESISNIISAQYNSSIIKEQIETVLAEKGLRESDIDFRAQNAKGIKSDEQIAAEATKEKPISSYEFNADLTRDLVRTDETTEERMNSVTKQVLVQDMNLATEVGDEVEFSGGASIDNLEALGKQQSILEHDAETSQGILDELRNFASLYAQNSEEAEAETSEQEETKVEGTQEGNSNLDKKEEQKSAAKKSKKENKTEEKDFKKLKKEE